MSFYNHKEIEPKWQKYWADHHTFKTGTDASKPKASCFQDEWGIIFIPLISTGVLNRVLNKSDY